MSFESHKCLPLLIRQGLEVCQSKFVGVPAAPPASAKGYPERETHTYSISTTNEA